MKLITHYKVDIDAASCAALVHLSGDCELDEIGYVSADIQRIPDHLRDALFVDLPIGIKGTGSALAELPRARELLGDQFVNEVDDADKHGTATSRFSLKHMFTALKVGLAAEGFYGKALDDAMIRQWTTIVRGISKMHNNSLRAASLAHQIPLVEVGPYTFAVPTGPMPKGSGAALDDRGVVATIYHADYGIGIHRHDTRKTPDLSRLAPYLLATKKIRGEEMGWFVHNRGFLTCWGSKKAKRYCSPPKGTPQNQKEMIQMLKAVYGRDS